MADNFVQRGGLWVMGQGALLCAVIAGGILCRGQWHSLAVTLCGAGLLLIAGGCGLAGTLSLGGNLTPFPKPSAGGRLVRTGIYGLMRHPLYTAVFCGALGWALVWRSWPGDFSVFSTNEATTTNFLICFDCSPAAPSIEKAKTATYLTVLLVR